MNCILLVYKTGGGGGGGGGGGYNLKPPKKLVYSSIPLVCYSIEPVYYSVQLVYYSVQVTIVLFLSDTGTGSGLPPPVCAVGVSPLLLGHTPKPVEVTCILCQEETKDFASQERTFVQAAHVQRSAVLRRCQPSDSSKGRPEPVSALGNHKEA